VRNSPPSCTVSAGTKSYAYFDDGRRAVKETPAGATNFIWDGQDVLIEKDAALATTGRYTGFPGAWGGPGHDDRLLHPAGR